MENVDKITREMSLWVWLALACEPGSTIPKKLYEKYNSIEDIYAATEEDYEECCPYIGRKKLVALCQKSLDEAIGIVRWCESHNTGILTYDDISYPKRLKEITGPPAVLYYIGNIPNFNMRLCVATVGTRNMSEYGRTNAYKITTGLAICGAIIVSGLAAGIDTVCHRAALDVSCKTVAVLGCGIDRVYPKKNRDLMREIARKGLLLTEYPPGTPPNGYNFPLRNRIISGLSHATVVYEADLASGALITAQLAKKEGRAVYAMPGQVGNTNSLGTNDIIREGGKIIVEAIDLIADFFDVVDTLNPRKAVRDTLEQKRRKKEEQSKGADKTNENDKPKAQSNTDKKQTSVMIPARKEERESASKHRQYAVDDPFGDLSANESLIFNSLKKATPKTFDDFAELGIDAPDITVALTMLEIKGLIIPLPGGAYAKS